MRVLVVPGKGFVYNVLQGGNEEDMKIILLFISCFVTRE